MIRLDDRPDGRLIRYCLNVGFPLPSSGNDNHLLGMVSLLCLFTLRIFLDMESYVTCRLPLKDGKRWSNNQGQRNTACTVSYTRRSSPDQNSCFCLSPFMLLDRRLRLACVLFLFLERLPTRVVAPLIPQMKCRS